MERVKRHTPNLSEIGAMIGETSIDVLEFLTKHSNDELLHEYHRRVVIPYRTYLIHEILSQEQISNILDTLEEFRRRING